MVGRAAMTSPWLFRQAKHFLETGEIVPDPSVEERWNHILRHCRMAVAESDSAKHAMAAMRGRLMAYSKGMPGGRILRGRASASLLGGSSGSDLRASFGVVEFRRLEKFSVASASCHQLGEVLSASCQCQLGRDSKFLTGN